MASTASASRVLDAFQDAQLGVRTHARGVKAVTAAVAASTAAATEAVLTALDRVLAAPKLNAAVERSLQFVAAAVSANAATLLAPVVKRLSDRSGCDDRFVRLRSCVGLDLVLAALSAEADVPDALVDDAIVAFHARMTDKIAGVRVAACRAVARLQAPLPAGGGGDAGVDACPIRSSLAAAATTDPSADVRMAALQALLLHPDAAGQLLTRCIRDVSPEVRCAAFTKLALQVPWAQVTPVQRVHAVAVGTADAVATVRDQCCYLMAAWLVGLGGDWEAWVKGLRMPATSSDAATPPSNSAVVAAAMAGDAVVEAGLNALFTWAAAECPSDKMALRYSPIASSLAAVVAGGGAGGGLMAVEEGDDATATTEPAPGDWAGEAEESDENVEAGVGHATGQGGATHVTSTTALWRGVRAAIADFTPSTSDVTVEGALYWRVRARWLVSVSPTAAAHARGKEDDEEAEGLIPTPAVWADVLAAVAVSAGCPVDVDACATPFTWPSELVDARVTAAITAATHVRPLDADALDMMVQWLKLGVMLDFGDEAGRVKASRVCVRLLVDPSLPANLVPAITPVLHVALGATVACPRPSLLRSMAAMYISLIAACTAATAPAIVAAAAPTTDTALTALQAAAECVRIKLEALDEEGEGDGQEVVALTAQLSRLEVDIAAAAATADGTPALVTPIPAHLATIDGGHAMSPGERTALWLGRAVALMHAALAGAGVPPSAHVAVTVPALTPDGVGDTHAARWTAWMSSTVLPLLSGWNDMTPCAATLLPMIVASAGSASCAAMAISHLVAAVKGWGKTDEAAVDMLLAAGVQCLVAAGGLDQLTAHGAASAFMDALVAVAEGGNLVGGGGGGALCSVLQHALLTGAIPLACTATPVVLSSLFTSMYAAIVNAHVAGSRGDGAPQPGDMTAAITTASTITSSSAFFSAYAALSPRHAAAVVAACACRALPLVADLCLGHGSDAGRHSPLFASAVSLLLQAAAACPPAASDCVTSESGGEASRSSTALEAVLDDTVATAARHAAGSPAASLAAGAIACTLAVTCGEMAARASCHLLSHAVTSMQPLSPPAPAPAMAPAFAATAATMMARLTHHATVLRTLSKVATGLGVSVEGLGTGEVTGPFAAAMMQCAAQLADGRGATAGTGAVRRSARTRTAAAGGSGRSQRVVAAMDDEGEGEEGEEEGDSDF